MMRFLSHVIETKGLVHSVERSAQVIKRYSFGKKRFSDMMASLDGDLDPRGRLRVTFCVTASLLEDHSGFITGFGSKGHEFAAHGYHHTDMKKKTKAEQAGILDASSRLFARHGIKVNGFRCPYLSYDSGTIEALKESSYAWTSNDIVFWKDSPGNSHFNGRSLKKLDSLYRSHSSLEKLSVPSFMGRILDIPITAPDDEMVFERYRIKDGDAIWTLWRDILLKVHERGELFHLLFHPERFEYVKGSIASLARFAATLHPAIWFPTLSEITDWCNKRRYAGWSWKTLKNSLHECLFDGPDGATVLIKTNSGSEFNFYGDYLRVDMKPAEEGRYVLTTAEPRRHMVFISQKSPVELEEFLREEGFIVKRSALPQRGALFIGEYVSFGERDKIKLLEKIDGSPFPLLRLWRWPRGCRSAFTVSADVDSLNVGDFFKRLVNF